MNNQFLKSPIKLSLSIGQAQVDGESRGGVLSTKAAVTSRTEDTAPPATRAKCSSKPGTQTQRSGSFSNKQLPSESRAGYLGPGEEVVTEKTQG